MRSRTPAASWLNPEQPRGGGSFKVARAEDETNAQEETGGLRVFNGSPRLRRARETRELVKAHQLTGGSANPKISPSRTSRPPRLPVEFRTSEMTEQ
jgi:hypothetical protein